MQLTISYKLIPGMSLLKGAFNPEVYVRLHKKKKNKVNYKDQPQLGPIGQNSVYSSSPFPPCGQPYLTHPAVARMSQ